MSTVFITGDRALDPVNALNLLIAVINSLDDQESPVTSDDTFITGDLPTGIERAARYLFLGAEVMSYSKTDEGYTDFAGLYKIVNDVADRVLFVHADPLGSRIGTNLMQNVASDKITILP